MSKKNLYLLLFSITFISSNIFAVQANSMFFNIKANISAAPSPMFFVQNVSNKMSMGGSSNKWLLIEIEYKTPAQSQASNYSEHSFNEYNRNFSIKYEAVLPGRNSFYYLTANVDYATISFDSNTKYAMVLIPPQLINKILQSSNKLVKYLKKINLRVTFMLDGKTESVFFYPPGSNINDREFNNIINGNNVIKIPGGLLNRMQSPWSVINYNKYELIRQ